MQAHKPWFKYFLAMAAKKSATAKTTSTQLIRTIEFGPRRNMALQMTMNPPPNWKPPVRLKGLGEGEGGELLYSSCASNGEATIDKPALATITTDRLGKRRRYR